MKLLHVSDIHFGTRFLNKDQNVRKILIEASYKTFDKVVDYILNNDVKALLIPGDLFDGEYRSLRAEKYLIDTFKSLNNYGVKVFYALGNHDSNTTFKNGFLRALPSNVIIFNKEKPSSYLLEEKTYIHSCGHQSSVENRNLVENFPEAIKGYYNIGLLHCSIVSNMNDQQLYLPTKIEDLESKNYDYWALGHIHKREQVSSNIYYSGSLYGLNSKETGNKGALLIDLKNENLSVEFVDLSTVNYETLVVDLHEESINSQYALLKSLDVKIDHFNKKTMLKLVLTGSTELYTYLKKDNNLKELRNEIMRKDRIIEVSIDISGIEGLIDYKDLIQADNILGYIEKGLNDHELIKEIKEKYNLDPTDKAFIRELMNMMVGEPDEY